MENDELKEEERKKKTAKKKQFECAHYFEQLVQ